MALSILLSVVPISPIFRNDSSLCFLSSSWWPHPHSHCWGRPSYVGRRLLCGSPSHSAPAPHGMVCSRDPCCKENSSIQLYREITSCLPTLDSCMALLMKVWLSQLSVVTDARGAWGSSRIFWSHSCIRSHGAPLSPCADQTSALSTRFQRLHTLTPQHLSLPLEIIVTLRSVIKETGIT